MKQIGKWLRRHRVQIATLGLVLFLWLSHPSVLSFLIGMTVISVGLGLRLWAAGIVRKNQQLATTGPYALMRHPLYAGTLLVIVGTCLIARSWPFTLIVLFWSSVIHTLSILKEEAILRKLFGSVWDDYVVQTPRLLPLRWKPLGRLRGDFSWTQVVENREHKRFPLMAVALGILYWLKVAPHLSRASGILKVAMMVVPAFGATYLASLALQRRSATFKALFSRFRSWLSRAL